VDVMDSNFGLVVQDGISCCSGDMCKGDEIPTECLSILIHKVWV
jgi:hypothetical protein